MKTGIVKSTLLRQVMFCAFICSFVMGISANDDFTNKEVVFDSVAEGIKIAGTLSTPNDDSRHPAILMITGNGPHIRDQIISGSPMFKMLGDHFAGKGFVVLRTDARGYGRSTGTNDWEKYTTADRVLDNRAALRFLREQKNVDPTKIILFGHSEGALIAAALAASNENTALTVLLSTSVLRGDDVVARQLARSLIKNGASERTAEAVRSEFLRFAAHAVKSGKDDADFQKIALAFLKAHGVADDKLDVELAKSLLKGYLNSPWYKYFFSFDPTLDLARIKTPIFAIFAGEDENVPWNVHLPPLIEALKRSRNTDLSAVVIPEQDHFFLEFEGRRREKHIAGKMVISEELLAALDSEFERRRLSRSPCNTSEKTK